MRKEVFVSNGNNKFTIGNVLLYAVDCPNKLSFVNISAGGFFPTLSVCSRICFFTNIFVTVTVEYNHGNVVESCYIRQSTVTRIGSVYGQVVFASLVGINYALRRCFFGNSVIVIPLIAVEEIFYADF